MQAHTTAFVEAISVEIGGLRVYEVPPNGQGIAALLALNILKELGVLDTTKASSERQAGEGNAKDDAMYLHRLIEALRLAFADTRWYCADMDKAHVPVEDLLGQAYAEERSKQFDPSR